MSYEPYHYSNENNTAESYTINRYPNENNTTDSYTSNRYPNDTYYRSYIPNEPKQNEKKEKVKKSSLWKKVLGFSLAGIMFGVCAGASFYFITSLADFSDRKMGIVSEVEEKQEVSQGDVAGDMSANAESPSGIDVLEPQVVSTVVTDVTEVVDKVMPSVVSITNVYTETTNFFGQSFANEAESSGSGIILGENEEELLLVTNYHVVASADTLKVQFINETVAEAQLKGADSNMDLAVIAVRLEDLDEATKSAISIATMGDSSALKVGEPAIAIGNALGYGQSVTTGVISALDRQIEMSEDGSVTGKLIQTDAAINPGNSGGALLNVRGEVIGINSNKIGGSAIEGMGYAIPISSAEPIIENLMSKETKAKVDDANKGYLGITGINVTPEVSKTYGMPKGVYVTQVYEGTAAAEAGIMNGDIIVGFEGSTVGSMEDLQGYLAYYEIGEQAEVTVKRATAGSYEDVTITVTLGKAAQIEN